MHTNQTGSRGGNLVLCKTKLVQNENGIAINGASTMNYTIDGIMYNSTAPLANQAFTTGHTALSTNESCVFAVWINSGNTVSTTQGAVVNQLAVTAGTTVIPLPADDETRALLGLIKVTTTNAATFTPNTTALNAANVSTTFYDTALMPSKPFTTV